MQGIEMKFDQAEFAKIKSALKKLGDDKSKRSEILKILRRQVKPAIETMKMEAPIAQNDVKYHRDKSITYKKGNLRRSIKSFTGKSKEFPSVYVGPNAPKKDRIRKGQTVKKAEGSGYYGWFVNWNKGRIKEGKNFLQSTANKSGLSVQTGIMNTTSKYIQRRAKELGFD